MRLPWVAGGLCFPIQNHFGSEKQAGTAHVTDAFMPFSQFRKALPGIGANMKCIVLQVFLLQHVQGRKGSSAGNRVSSEGVEIFKVPDRGSVNPTPLGGMG